MYNQFSSVAQSCLTLCNPMNQSTPGLPFHHQLPEFTQTHVHQVGDAIQPSHPLSPLFLLPPISPSIRVFSNVSTLHMRWPKYWSFSFSIIPSKEPPGLISIRMHWLDLLANHRITLISLQHPTQYKSSLKPPSKSPSLSPGPILIVQFSYSVVPDSLGPHELQHTRLPNPSPTPGACSNSCPLSQ